ncbi:MAG TPA: tetratricopeptide repeat protein [Nitrososphaera sp.]|nr:tetratricopeptide repeat protein [Nitrososphaera sp.]
MVILLIAWVALFLLQEQEGAEAHHSRGDLEERAGNFREAAKEYEIAARLDPSEKNLFDLGSELLKYHGYRQALQIFSYAVDKWPESAKLRVGLGVAQYSLGKYREAVETLCRAVDLDPKDTRALGFLGKMYNVAPELSQEVTKRLERFARLYPNNPAANYYYALSLRGHSDKQAKALLLKSVTEDPAFAEAHYQLGLLDESDGLSATAIHEYEAAVRIRPDLAQARYHLARLYEKNGQPELARKEFRAFEALKAAH